MTRPRISSASRCGEPETPRRLLAAPMIQLEILGNMSMLVRIIFDQEIAFVDA